MRDDTLNPSVPDPAPDAVADPVPADDEAPRLVVALGASAGGLEALEQFFDRLSPDTGCAFVVVQHLSPGHKSLMAELLARHTRMPVERATDGMRLERNRVFLNDARHNLVVDGRHLRLVARPDPPGLNLPIDLFLESLARQWGERAVGIILSGTGSDGTRGIRAVHAAGGVVLAQDVATARFDGMPRSAAATGVIHATLAPGEMPAALDQALSAPDGLRGGMVRREPTSEDEAYIELMALASRASSVDLSHYKRSTVMRRIARRLAATGTESLLDYLRLARGAPTELDQLTRELLISVTRFFRDREVFATLQGRVIRQIVAHARDAEPIRVWVAGCATGEEAYSIGMLFLEEMEAARRSLDVRVFATDLDRTALDTASAGVYGPTITEDVSAERLARFFDWREDHYVVRRPLRQIVFFAQHNVVGDPPFTHVSLVSCRNLLIYLEPVLQTRALTSFRFALERGGTLLLGISEGIGGMTDCFTPIDSRLRLFEATGERALPEIGPPRFGIVRPGTAARRPDDRQQVVTEATQALLRAYAPPAVLVDEQCRLVHVFGDVRPHLQIASGEANLDVLSMLPAELAPVFAAGVSRTVREERESTYAALVAMGRESRQRVTLRMRPLEGGPSAPRRVLVAFEADAPVAAEAVPAEGPEAGVQLVELTRELEHSRENLQALVEELETSNEELQALNEELTTSNEELHSTNEELQAVNEELQTVNAEYERKIEELRQLNHDIDNILRCTTIGTLLLDEQLAIRKFTPAATHFVSLLERDLGRPVEHLATQFGGSTFLEDVRAVLADGRPREHQMVTGGRQHVLVRVAPYLTDRPTPAGAVVSFVDVSSLAEANLRTQKVLDSLPHQVAMLDRDGTIVMVNASWTQFARLNGGADGPVAVGTNYLHVCGIERLPSECEGHRVRLQLQQLLSGEIERFELEYPCHSPDEQRWFVMHATRVGGVGAVVSHIDITSRKIAELQLRELTQVDPLTGLLNRRGLADVLAVEASRAERAAAPICALLVDCDDFKSINDTLGYAAGDVALVMLTRSLVQTLRPSDRVARIGGDEFLVLLPDTRLVEAALVAERVRHAVAEHPVETPQGKTSLSVSVSVVPVEPGAAQLEALVVAGRDALQESKMLGKNRVTLASRRGPGAAELEDPGHVGRLVHGAEVISVVRQPIVRLATGEVVGHELLARGPIGPLFYPQDFFRRASADGVLVALDLKCLRAALADAAGLQGWVHVNLYPATLRETPIEHILRLFPGGSARRRYCIELSEQQLFGDPSFIRDAVARLREASVRLAIDDVGFGRTSLEGLVLLEPDVAKLDRRWVGGAAHDRARLRTLKRLCEVARALGATIVAEGIESDDDLRALMDLGVELGQGFLWGNPGGMPVS